MPKKWPPFPDTRKFHSIANAENGKLDVRTFSCCCKGYLQGDEPCSNVVYPDEWKQYNFSTKNFGKATRNLWLDTCADQIHKIEGNAAGDQNTNRQEEVDWSR